MKSEIDDFKMKCKEFCSLHEMHEGYEKMIHSFRKLDASEDNEYAFLKRVSETSYCYLQVFLSKTRKEMVRWEKETKLLIERVTYQLNYERYQQYIHVYNKNKLHYEELTAFSRSGSGEMSLSSLLHYVENYTPNNFEPIRMIGTMPELSVRRELQKAVDTWERMFDLISEAQVDRIDSERRVSTVWISAVSSLVRNLLKFMGKMCGLAG